MSAAAASAAVDSKDSKLVRTGVNYVVCPASYAVADGAGKPIAPSHQPPFLSVFLGGGISGCPDWQNAVKEELSKRGQTPGLVLVNPRRAAFDVKDKSLTASQIRWEFNHLHAVDAIVFWFCAETLCPITLYELGSWSVHPSRKTLFVGTANDYSRKEDVVVQTGLVRPELKVVHSLTDIVSQIESWYKARTANPTGSVVPTPAGKQPKKEDVSARVEKIRSESEFDEISTADETAVVFAHYFRKFMIEVDGDASDYDCYVRMSEFRFGASNESIVSTASSIIDQFVREGAATEVDLPAPIRDQIMTDFKDATKFSKGIFTRAEGELRERIEHDIWPRFLEDNKRIGEYAHAELYATLNGTSSADETAAATAAAKK